jgi:hypothetical protein
MDWVICGWVAFWLLIILTQEVVDMAKKHTIDEYIQAYVNGETKFQTYDDYKAAMDQLDFGVQVDAEIAQAEYADQTRSRYTTDDWEAAWKAGETTLAYPDWKAARQQLDWELETVGQSARVEA